MPVEAEIKLDLPAKSLAKVAKSPRLGRLRAAPKHSVDIVSVYYDTQKRKLRKRGITLRLRRHGRRKLQTVKAAGDGLFTRHEWEREVDGATPDFDAARGTALEPLLDKKLRRQLAPLFETRVRRTIMPLRRGHSEIELSMDRGQLRSAGKVAPIHEVELELKKGEAADLMNVVRTVADVAPVRLGALSKAERGYRLVEGEQGEAIKRAPIALSREMSTAQGFRAIALACLRQVAANHAAAKQPEGVHQMRVGLRRLRAVLALFSDLLDADPQTEKVKHELKWLTEQLGPAREFDVYRRNSVMPADRAQPGVRLLNQVAGRRAEAAFDDARRAIESTRYRKLTLDVVDWLNAGAWLTRDDKLLRNLRARDIADFAADELSRRRRKIVRKVKKFDSLDTRGRHKLRIASKKLRYGTEFFAALFDRGKPAQRRRKFLKTLKRALDCLGDLNDIAAHDALGRNLAMPQPARRRRPQPRRRAFAVGFVAGQEKAKVKPLSEDAKAALMKFCAVTPFWA